MDGASSPEMSSSSVTYFESNRRNWSPQVVAKSFLAMCMVLHGLKPGNMGAFPLCLC